MSAICLSTGTRSSELSSCSASSAPPTAPGTSCTTDGPLQHAVGISVAAAAARPCSASTACTVPGCRSCSLRRPGMVTPGRPSSPPRSASPSPTTWRVRRRHRRGRPAVAAVRVRGPGTVLLEEDVSGGQVDQPDDPHLPGFPHGVNGELTAGRTCEQAWMMAPTSSSPNARSRSTGSATGARSGCCDGHPSSPPGRSWLATGIAWRRLGVAPSEALSALGVFYGAAGRARARAMQGQRRVRRRRRAAPSQGRPRCTWPSTPVGSRCSFAAIPSPGRCRSYLIRSHRVRPPNVTMRLPHRDQSTAAATSALERLTLCATVRADAPSGSPPDRRLLRPGRVR